MLRRPDSSVGVRRGAVASSLEGESSGGFSAGDSARLIGAQRAPCLASPRRFPFVALSGRSGIVQAYQVPDVLTTRTLKMLLAFPAVLSLWVETALAHPRSWLDLQH